MQQNWLVTVGMFFVRAMMPLVRILPPRIGTSIAAAFGGFLSNFFDREARVATSQLAYALGGNPKDHRKTYKGVFRHLGSTVSELVQSERFLPTSPEEANQVSYSPTPYISCSAGANDLMLKYASSKTAILALASHLGNFELQAAFYAHCGVPLYVIGRKPNYEAVAEFAEQVRAKHKLTTIWREDPSSARKLIKALKTGGVLGALIDQDIDLENGFSNFFGLEAASPIAPIRLAVKHKVPIIYSFSERVEPLRHVIHTGPIEYDTQATPEKAIQMVLDVYNARLEEFVRRCPEQWVWWHRRWRRRPDIDYQKTPELLRSTNDYVSWIEQQDSVRNTSAVS